MERGSLQDIQGRVIVMMFQFKDGISVDLQQSEKVKVSKEDFEQALLDVKPVGVLCGHMIFIIMSFLPSGIWCEQ